MLANLTLLAVGAMSIAATVVALLMVRFWIFRTRRRSPLAHRQAGHVPGQQLRLDAGARRAVANALSVRYPSLGE